MMGLPARHLPARASQWQAGRELRRGGRGEIKNLSKFDFFGFSTHYSNIPSFHKRGKSKNPEKVLYLQYVVEIPI